MLVVEHGTDWKEHREVALIKAVMDQMEESVKFVEDTYTAVHRKQHLVLSGEVFRVSSTCGFR
jgi:hypothetical protein